MKTIKEVTNHLNERISDINTETVSGVRYCRYDTGMVVDNHSVELIVFEYENGYVEFQCNLFWFSPLSITERGEIRWSSGPSKVAGSSDEIARVMSYMFQVASDDYLNS